MDRAPRLPSLFVGQDLSSFAFPFVTAVLFWQLFPSLWLILSAAVFLIAALCCVFLRDRRRVCAFVMAGVAAGMIFSGVNMLSDQARLSRNGATLSGQGIVLRQTDGSRLALFRAEGDLLPAAVLIREELTPGTKFYGILTLDADLTASDRANGADYAAAGEVTPSGRDPILHALGRFREKALALWGSGTVGAFYRAALLGDRTGLSGSLKTAFRDDGAMHLLAVSGLHVSQVLGAIYYILFFLTRDRRLTRAVMLLFLPGVAVITGAGLPVLRATLMTGIALIVSLFRVRPAPLTELSLAALILAIARPWAVGSASYLLTFSCTLGIIAAAGPLTRRLEQGMSDSHPLLVKLAQASGGSVFLSLSAFVFTLPVQAYFIGSAQPFAALYNVFFIPLFAPCVALGILSLPAAFVPALGFLKIPAQYYGKFFLFVIRFVADGALGTNVALGAMAPFCAVLALAVILLAFVFRIRCDRFLLVALFLMAAVFLPGLFF